LLKVSALEPADIVAEAASDLVDITVGISEIG
jgi:hypothetical protein